MFIRCSVWREHGENVAESLSKGMRVLVTGRLTVRSYEYNGQQRTSLEMQVDEIGPSLRYARAQVTKVAGGGSGGGNFGGGNGYQGGGGYGGGRASYDAPQGGSAHDPWSSGPQGGSAFDDNPPFCFRISTFSAAQAAWRPTAAATEGAQLWRSKFFASPKRRPTL